MKQVEDEILLEIIIDKCNIIRSAMAILFSVLRAYTEPNRRNVLGPRELYTFEP